MPALLTRRIAKRLSRGLPIVQIWAIANLALLAGRHVAKLDPIERRRFVELVRAGRGRPSNLAPAEADELRELTAKLELRLFAGSAANQLSPIGLPKRLVNGKTRR